MLPSSHWVADASKKAFRLPGATVRSMEFWAATLTGRLWPISARREQLRSDTGCQIKSWLRMQLWQLSRRGLTSWHHRWSAARVARAFPLPSAALGTYRGPSRDEDCADDQKNGGKYMCTARTRSTPKAAIGVPHRRGSVGRATPQQPGMSSALPSRLQRATALSKLREDSPAALFSWPSLKGRSCVAAFLALRGLS